MKNLSRNPYLYLSFVLAAALAFQVYGVVSAQTAEYKAPTQPPTGGMPAAPVNTGTAAQVKKSDFAVSPSATGFSSNNLINNFGVQIRTNGGIPSIYFITGSNGSAAGIRLYNGKLQFQNVNGTAWTDIGTGTGSGGELYWKGVPGTRDGNIRYSGGNVGIKVLNPLASLHVGGEAIIDRGLVVNGNLSILSSDIKTENAYLVGGYSDGGLIPSPYSATLTDEIIKDYWGDKNAARMSCDASALGKDCESVSGFLVEQDSSRDTKYDLFVSAYQQVGYGGECPLPPNWNPDSQQCKYYAAWQEFSKKSIENGVYYYKLTGSAGGIDPTTFGQAPVSSGPSIGCEKSDDTIDCPSEYSIGVSATSPAVAYDFYTRRECADPDYFYIGGNVDCRYENYYTFANEYTLAFTEPSGKQGGALVAGDIESDSLSLKKSIGGSITRKTGADWYELNSSNRACGKEQRGELRFFENSGALGDRICACAYGTYDNEKDYRWRCW